MYILNELHLQESVFTTSVKASNSAVYVEMLFLHDHWPPTRVLLQYIPPILCERHLTICRSGFVIIRLFPFQCPNWRVHQSNSSFMSLESSQIPISELRQWNIPCIILPRQEIGSFQQENMYSKPVARF